jgi:hypothetical protein
LSSESIRLGRPRILTRSDRFVTSSMQQLAICYARSARSASARPGYRQWI